MTTLKIVKPSTSPQRATHTTVDTIVVTPALVKDWKNPPFQRPLRVNDKLKHISEQLKVDGGVIPGVITIGVLNREKFLLDGQHRREAFLMAEIPEGYCDVRIHHFETMADMGQEFVQLNSSISKLRPDDILRGLEGSIAGLALIRKKCPYVGYDMIRRRENSPILSMSLLLRAWFGSAAEVPSSSGQSAAMRASQLTIDEAESCIDFLKLADSAWGRDREYVRLWSSLNMIMCMWLYRRTVITTFSPKSVRLTKDAFVKCLMALSANGNYVAWLVGRGLTEHDRSPCYARIKTIVAKRIETDTGKKAALPSPPWSHHLWMKGKI